MPPTEIIPLPLGLFSVPGREVAKYPGVVVRAPYVVCAYLVRTPDTTLLFDTGIVGDEDAVARYRPRWFALDEQLAAHGVALEDVDVVVNCHLHADHAGGNHLFAGTPIVVQEAELAAAGQDGYTVRAAVADFPGASFIGVDGRYAVADRLTVVPTRGHSPGHQSMVVEGTPEGTVLLAGQAFDSAGELASAVLAKQLGADVHDSTAPDWVDDLMRLDIDVALFAHDLAQWRPPRASFVGSRPRAAWPA